MGGRKEGCGGGRGGGVDCEVTSKPTGEKCDIYWNSEVSELLTPSGASVKCRHDMWNTHTLLLHFTLSPHTHAHSPLMLTHSPLTLTPIITLIPILTLTLPLSHSQPLSHHHTHSYPYTHSSIVTLLILLASSRVPEGSSLLYLFLYNASKRVHSIPAWLFWTIYSAHTDMFILN